MARLSGGQAVARQHVAVQRGFTLVEVLIALAITGMVVSVLMSSVFYAGKVQSAIRSELVDREQLLRSKAWFVELLATCLPADAPSGSAFEGTAKEVVCDTLMPLQGSKFLGPQRVKLALKSGPAQNLQLMYSVVGSSSEAQLIADLPYSSGRFAYVGVNGLEVPKWPTQFNDPQTLPRRIHLTLGAGSAIVDETVWAVGLQASPWLEPKAAIPFGDGVLPR